MNKKAAIELSANFLVIIIISVVIFGFGIYLFAKIYATFLHPVEKLDEDIMLMIESKLHEGDKVAIIPSSIELERKNSKIFGIGINNIDETEQVFRIFIQQSDYVNNNQTLNCGYESSTKDYRFEGVVCASTLDILPLNLNIEGDEEFVEDTISAGGYNIEEVKITAPPNAKSGQYGINICVCQKESEGSICDSMDTCIKTMGYDSLYKISKVTVTVK